MAIGTLIQDAIEVFIENEDAILDGTFGVSLMDKSKYEAQITDIISLSIEKVYQSQEVVEKEIAGYKIISDILDVYITALMREKEGNASNYDRLMLSTLPEFYRETESSAHKILLNTCCYVASLSDSAAVHIHNKIMGRQL